MNQVDKTKEPSPCLKRVILGICVLLVTAVVGYLLLVLVYCIPVEGMYNNMVSSCDIFEKEGTYPKKLWNYNSRLDNYSDAIMLMMASQKSDESTWKAALNNETYFELMPDEIFVDVFANGNTDHNIFPYIRYWHGYQVFLKPLAYVMNYRGIRVVMIVCQMCIIAMLIYQCMKYDKRIVLPVIGLWIFLNPIATMLSIQLSTVTVVTFVNLIIVMILSHKEIRDRKLTWDIVFLLNGCATVYFSTLTFPILAWGAPLVLWYYLNVQEDHTGIADIFELSAFWGAGFAGMWAAKWVIGTILTGTDMIGDAIHQATIWSSSDIGRLQMYFEALLRNCGAAVQISVAFYILYMMVRIFRILRRRRYSIKPFIVYLLIMIAPFVWYFITVKHAYVHYWFTYRNMGMSVLALHLVLLKMQEEKGLADG